MKQFLCDLTIPLISYRHGMFLEWGYSVHCMIASSRLSNPIQSIIHLPSLNTKSPSAVMKTAPSFPILLLLLLLLLVATHTHTHTHMRLFGLRHTYIHLPPSSAVTVVCKLELKSDLCAFLHESRARPSERREKKKKKKTQNRKQKKTKQKHATRRDHTENLEGAVWKRRKKLEVPGFSLFLFLWIEGYEWGKSFHGALEINDLLN